MDNYLLTGHILRCKVVSKNEVHPELWVGANRRWRTVSTPRLVRAEHNKVIHNELPSLGNHLLTSGIAFQARTEDEQARAVKRLIKRQKARNKKLADAGIKYDFEAVSYVSRIVLVSIY